MNPDTSVTAYDGPGVTMMAPDFGSLPAPPPTDPLPPKPPTKETDEQALRRILGHVTGVSVHFSKGVSWNMDIPAP